MRRSPLFGIVAFVALACGSERAPGPTRAAVENPLAAAPKEGEWLKIHEAFLKRKSQGKIELLFLGDSITAWWTSQNGEGRGPVEVWNRYYAPRRAANFGIPGDRVENLLWRIENGEVDGLAPKLVVVMIGTNNAGIDTPSEVADGIARVVRRLRDKLPASKILLLGIFPRSRPSDSIRERNNAVNERLRKLDDGKAVTYLDLGPRFVDSEGMISPEIMPDSLHLSRRGYEIWAEAMEPTLRERLGED